MGKIKKCAGFIHRGDFFADECLDTLIEMGKIAVAIKEEKKKSFRELYQIKVLVQETGADKLLYQDLAAEHAKLFKVDFEDFMDCLERFKASMAAIQRELLEAFEQKIKEQIDRGAYREEFQNKYGRTVEEKIATASLVMMISLI